MADDPKDGDPDEAVAFQSSSEDPQERRLHDRRHAPHVTSEGVCDACPFSTEQERQRFEGMIASEASDRMVARFPWTIVVGLLSIVIGLGGWIWRYEDRRIESLESAQKAQTDAISNVLTANALEEASIKLVLEKTTKLEASIENKNDVMEENNRLLKELARRLNR